MGKVSRLWEAHVGRFFEALGGPFGEVSKALGGTFGKGLEADIQVT